MGSEVRYSGKSKSGWEWVEVACALSKAQAVGFSCNGQEMLRASFSKKEREKKKKSLIAVGNSICGGLSKLTMKKALFVFDKTTCDHTTIMPPHHFLNALTHTHTYTPRCYKNRTKTIMCNTVKKKKSCGT